MKNKRGDAATVVLSILVILVIVGAIGGAIGVAISSSGATPTPTATPTATPEGSFTYEGILLGINEWDDYDGDGISDRIEYLQWNTDPTSIYTNNNPIDDFNAVYTYGLDPLDSAEIAEFMSRIPNVEAKRWASDGQNEQIVADVILRDKEIVEIGMRDPVVQYYAGQVSIDWQDAEHNLGSLKLNGQPFFLSYYSDANYGKSDSVSISFYFTHGRKGVCGSVSLAQVATLNLMGYDCKCIWGKIEDGRDHAWVEVVIDNINYVVSYNLIEKADSFYRENNWTITSELEID